MRGSATAKWIVLALVGLAIAVGVAIAAADLTSQQIGIASESVSAGDALAPSLSVPGEAERHPQSGDHGGPDEEPSTNLPTPTPAEPSFEEPTPTTEEPSSPSSESAGEDHGQGPDGDD